MSQKTDYGSAVRGSEAAASASTSRSRTFERGLDLLDLIAAAPGELTVGQLSDRLGTHRAVVHRLLRSLVARRLVVRRPGGRYDLGADLLVLAAQVVPRLRTSAAPELRRLANDLRATAIVSVAEADEAVTIGKVEPEGTSFHVGTHVGLRRPLTVGASGLAILAASPPVDAERPEIAVARERGYAVTRDEVESGAIGIAAPVGTQASVAVVSFGHLDEPAVGARVIESARAIAADLR